MSEDYYSVLGVYRDATADDIKKAFRELAKKCVSVLFARLCSCSSCCLVFRCHPDVNPGNAEAEASFKRINEAYAILSDDAERRAYNHSNAFAGHDWSKTASQFSSSRRPIAARRAWVRKHDNAVAADPLDWAEWYRAHYGMTAAERTVWREQRRQAAASAEQVGQRGPGAAHRAWEARRAARAGGATDAGSRHAQRAPDTYRAFADGFRTAERAAARAAPWAALAAGIAALAIVVSVHGGGGGVL